MILREIKGINAVGFTTFTAIRKPEEPNNSLVDDEFDGGTYIIALAPNNPTYRKGLVHEETGKPKADQFVLFESFSLDEVVRQYKSKVKEINHEL